MSATCSGRSSYVSSVEPHPPFTGPHNSLYDPDTLPVDETFRTYPEGHSLFNRIRAEFWMQAVHDGGFDLNPTRPRRQIYDPDTLPVDETFRTYPEGHSLFNRIRAEFWMQAVHDGGFDLNTDPAETTNLFDRPGQRDRVRWMAARLRLWQETVGDTAPLPGV